MRPREPQTGDMLLVRAYGTSLWVSLVDQQPYNPFEHLVTGSRLVYLGKSTDYYVRVLTQSGKVGWVHRGNLIGVAMPSRTELILRSLKHWWEKRTAAWWQGER